ncbi:MAG: isoprenyl transferase [Chitinophagales bacterium]|nr:isoprenyl transferase [Bacteroidota bacterium]
MDTFKEKLQKENIPQHVAIIMDGNGRWATQKWGRNRLFGHKNGVKAVRLVTEAAIEVGVKYVTLYAFSTENWSRPITEVNGLMELLFFTLRKEIKELHQNGVRLQTIGDLSKLPKENQKILTESCEQTAKNDRLVLNLALNYSGRWEICAAMQNIAQKIQQQQITVAQIDENLIRSNMPSANIPDPELLIRTSGEYRISNFLLWQIAYTELYFTETLWPDFDKEAFYKAIFNYQQRERRFGKTGEQILS